MVPPVSAGQVRSAPLLSRPSMVRGVTVRLKVVSEFDLTLSVPLPFLAMM